MDKFIDRTDAGIILAQHLEEYTHQKNTLVLALPRGGVPVAYEIATRLSLPLDIFIVRKLGFPEHEEYAMGALAPGGVVIFNEALLKQINLDKTLINQVIEAEQKELRRRERVYRSNRPFPSLFGKTIILVDDGIATGFTMRAAIVAIRQHKPAMLVVAVPVAANETCVEIAPLVDKLVCPLRPVNFYAVGFWYKNFDQTSDDEVLELIAERQNLM